jgi:hypothetical protein
VIWRGDLAGLRQGSHPGAAALHDSGDGLYPAEIVQAATLGSHAVMLLDQAGCMSRAN